MTPTAAEDRDDELRDISDEPIRDPAGFPGAAIAGGLLGVALLVLCGAMIRDLLVTTGAVSGETWTHRAADNLGSSTWSGWMWAIPAVCAVVGLVLLWLAVKPRRRTHLNVDGVRVVWTRPVDVARRASAAVSEVPNVRHALTTVGRRRIRVTVRTSGPVDRDRIAQVADDAVGAVSSGKHVVVKVRGPRKEFVE